MTVFGDAYASTYDMLYADKDYEAEAAYVDRIIQQLSQGAKSLIDLGCGTGRHARQFARIGYDVVGVDQSDSMLNTARKVGESAQLRFYQSNLLELDLPETYDAACALFHVMGYFPSSEDLHKVFVNISKHLRIGGVFVFDCWYGPAVHTQPPSVRWKRATEGDVEVIRIANPVLSADENVVDVCYKLLSIDRRSGTVVETEETHRMRYLFTPEVEWMMQCADLELVRKSEFMTDLKPSLSTWNVIYAGRRI